jgi:hypothetical protein
LGELHLGSSGAEMVDYLIKSTNNIEIAQSGGDNSEGVSGDKSYVLWNPTNTKGAPNEKNNTHRPSLIGLGHELAHKEDRWKGTMNNSTWYSTPDANGIENSVSKSEIYATHRENQLRTEHGIPLRTHYSPDDEGGKYEPSRIVQRGTAKSIFYDSNGATNYSPLSRRQTPYLYKNN